LTELAKSLDVLLVRTMFHLGIRSSNQKPSLDWRVVSRTTKHGMFPVLQKILANHAYDSPVH